ncbi:MAG: restriction endonuclease, partial [Candidatus Heimdallarchaeaceae archaeon]
MPNKRYALITNGDFSPEGNKTKFIRDELVKTLSKCPVCGKNKSYKRGWEISVYGPRRTGFLFGLFDKMKIYATCVHCKSWLYVHWGWSGFKYGVWLGFQGKNTGDKCPYIEETFVDEINLQLGERISKEEWISLIQEIEDLKYIREKKAQLIQREKKKEIQRKFEEEQKKRGLVKYKTSQGKKVWGTEEEIKLVKIAELGLKERFSNFSPIEFEEFIGKLFEKMGYSVLVAQHKQDFGVDLIVEKKDIKTVVEVKRYSVNNLVGNTVVRSVLGAIPYAKADKALVITTSDFTIWAEEQAKGSPVELWNFSKLKKLIEKYIIEVMEKRDYNSYKKQGENIEEYNFVYDSLVDKDISSVHEEVMNLL